MKILEESEKSQKKIASEKSAADNSDKFWYQVTKSNFECLDGDCIDDFPLYAKDTKQCLKSCKGTYYPFLFENNNRCNDKNIINMDDIFYNVYYNQSYALSQAFKMFKSILDSSINKQSIPQRNNKLINFGRILKIIYYFKTFIYIFIM